MGMISLHPQRMDSSLSSLFPPPLLPTQLLVMKRGPEFYFELDRALPSKPH